MSLFFFPEPSSVLESDNDGGVTIGLHDKLENFLIDFRLSRINFFF